MFSQTHTQYYHFVTIIIISLKTIISFELRSDDVCNSIMFWFFSISSCSHLFEWKFAEIWRNTKHYILKRNFPFECFDRCHIVWTAKPKKFYCQESIFFCMHFLPLSFPFFRFISPLIHRLRLFIVVASANDKMFSNLFSFIWLFKW